MKRETLVNYLNDILKANIDDNSSNGLQVEGRGEVKKIGLAVDACMDVYKKAADAKCDMLIVHHGLFWGSIKNVAGNARAHIKFLLDNDLNLYGSHLPLDMNEEYGNNIELARMIKLKSVEKFGIYHGEKIGFMGKLPAAKSAQEISDAYKKLIGGKHIILPFGKEKNISVAIISGGAPEELGQAIEAGVDLYITGEPAHFNHHQALEAKINVIFLGHYESETVGVKAIGAHLKKKFGLDCIFIDSPTIV